MAGGKLLLSYLDDNQVLALFPDARLPQLGPHTIRDRQELLENLSLIRHRSFATTLHESERGIDSLAVLLSGTSWRDRTALLVSVPSSGGGKVEIKRLAHEVRRIVSELRDDEGDRVTLAR